MKKGSIDQNSRIKIMDQKEPSLQRKQQEGQRGNKNLKSISKFQDPTSSSRSCYPYEEDHDPTTEATMTMREGRVSLVSFFFFKETGHRAKIFCRGFQNKKIRMGRFDLWLAIKIKSKIKKFKLTQIKKLGPHQ